MRLESKTSIANNELALRIIVTYFLFFLYGNLKRGLGFLISIFFWRSYLSGRGGRKGRDSNPCGIFHTRVFRNCLQLGNRTPP
jgi:hypothetical protein